MVAIGLFLLTLSILADWLRLGHARGFGSWQIAAILLAVVVISSGSMIRISSLSVLGLCVLILTLAADFLGLDGKNGFGIHQTAGLILACVLIALGILLGYVPKTTRPSRSRPARQGADGNP